VARRILIGLAVLVVAAVVVVLMVRGIEAARFKTRCDDLGGDVINNICWVHGQIRAMR
jgi:hypothetical protein